MKARSQVFSALLKYWRMRAGMSQLDLALTADVSSRHISFLETGRSQPSQEMVLLLAAVLDIPFRDRNVMLREAGFTPVFDEPGIHALDPGITHALNVMLRHHEPFPMMVLDSAYNLLRMNEAARCMIGLAISPIPDQFNVMRAFFDPAGFKPFVLDWELTARKAISRLQRELLHTPHDERLKAVVEDILKAPDVPADWQKHNLAEGTEGSLHIRFQAGEHTLSFVSTMMSFQAPQNITLEEIQIESYLPADAITEHLCRDVFGGQNKPA
ncbi:MAG: helix-turn-helix transcriptional regulator [Bacteroidota bacterium]